MTSLLRLLVGAALAWCVGLGVLAPETPLAADIAVLLVVVLASWRAAYGLAAVLVLAPAGVLLAPVPARVGELLAWALVATVLLRAWRMRSTASGGRGAIDRDGDRGAGLQADVRTPAILFGLCVAASWCGLTIAGAAGVEPGAIPLLLAHAIRADHLLFSSAEPETWTMLQVLAGLALLGTSMRIARADPEATRAAAWALVASGVLLALATEADVLRQWSREGYGGWFLWRYMRGERFSLHLADLNAAGSLYVLAGLAAVALASVDRARRLMWVVAGAVMLPALWLTGSRSAAAAVVLVGAGVVPLALRRMPRALVRAGAAALVALAVCGAGAGLVSASQAAAQGSAMSALRMRSQFFVTSARMFASAPVFGVGVGRYHERSAEFMPASLREVYPFENAHNYFAQQFAELGVVGGALFVWLVAAGVRAGWQGLAFAGPAPAPQLALVAGCIGYLLTCVTGHPLLVPEAALPFWAAFGVMAGTAANLGRSSGARSAASTAAQAGAAAAAQAGGSAAGSNGAQAAPAAPGLGRESSAASIARPVAATLVCLLLLAGVALQARRYARVSTPPGERGFHETETSRDGVRFTWMTGHGVFYIGAQPGFVVVPIRTPDLPDPRPRPFVVDVDVGGRRMGSYAIEPGRWNEIRVGVRDQARSPFRRVDLRANQLWTRRRDLGLREADDAPRSVMVGEVRWEPAGSR